MFFKKRTMETETVQKLLAVEIAERQWNEIWARAHWYDEFSILVRSGVDDIESLIRLHADRKRVIAAARDIADDMIREYEDRWAE